MKLENEGDFMESFPTYDNTDYYYMESGDPESLAIGLGLGLGVFMFMLVLGLAIYAVNSWLLSRVFKKAGVEAWKAWVPVYNTWVMFELGGQAGALVLLALIPFVGAIVAAVFAIIAMFNIGLKLGKSGAFTLLAVFLPIIWVAILAFDDSKWNEAAGAPRKDQPQVAYGPQGQPPYPPTAAPAQPVAPVQPETTASPAKNTTDNN